MKYLSAMLGLALCVASCTGNKDESKCDDNCDANAQQTETAATPAALANSEWILADFLVNDSTSTPNGEFVISFPTDSTFSMTTDCNVINGQFAQRGDSIAFTNLMTTRMMGPDMIVDDTFNATLPTVETVVVTDSTLTLNVNGAAFANFTKK